MSNELATIRYRLGQGPTTITSVLLVAEGGSCVYDVWYDIEHCCWHLMDTTTANLVEVLDRTAPLYQVVLDQDLGNSCTCPVHAAGQECQHQDLILHLLERGEIAVPDVCQSCRGTGTSPYPSQYAETNECPACRGSGLQPKKSGESA